MLLPRTVIIHDSIHILDPDRIDRPIQHKPGKVLLVLVRLAPQLRKDPLSPLVGDHVERAKHLGGRDSLGVHALLAVRLAD